MDYELSTMDYADPHEAVVSAALLSVIYQHDVFVLRLVEVAHGARRGTVLLPELIAVVSLFEQDGCLVFAPLFVIFHATLRGKLLAGPLTADIDVSARQARRLQDEVGDHVFCRRGIVHVIGTAQDIDAVLVLDELIVTPRHLGEERGVIERLEPLHAVHTHRCSMDIQYLETVILAPGREDKVLVVRELDAVRLADIGLS